MTGREAYDIYFNLVDPFRDEGTTEEEFSRHFNTAQMQVFEEDLSTLKQLAEREQRNIELNQLFWQMWTPLVHENIYSATLVNGTLDYQALRSAFPDDVIRDNDSIIETVKPDIRHILSIGRADSNGVYRACKWVRFNEKEKVENNPLTVGSENYPNYYQAGTDIFVTPIGVRTLQISLLRNPIHMWYESSGSANNVDPELPDATCHRIIKRAVFLTGINIREAALTAIDD